MKLLWCCVAATLLTITSAAVDVEKTVQQVQSILKANALLPRLTRDEIIDLLNDIREEDAKSNTVSKDKNTSKQKPFILTTTVSNNNEQDNEINTRNNLEVIKDNISTSGKDSSGSVSFVESTTKSSGATLTVVLPYTPRDGSSLQELYTRPPRVQVVAEPPKLPKPSKSGTKVNPNLKNHGKVPSKQKLDFPAELQAFLDAHGLKGTPGQDNFLLPLDGFKPLPPAKIVDGNVQLPENLLLTYDLISPSDLTTSTNKKDQKFAQTNFLYEPLRPEIPFELDTSSSESKQTILPLDLPKPRKTKAVSQPQRISTPNYEPIDYDAVKVIPLPKGPNPAEDEVVLGVQNKRQANESSDSDADSSTNTSTTNNDSDGKDSEAGVDAEPDTVAAGADSGASIADLEDSFGGAAPVQPGDSELPPPRKNGFYWMADWNSFLEVGEGDTKVNIRFEPKFGDPQMFLPVNVP